MVNGFGRMTVGWARECPGKEGQSKAEQQGGRRVYKEYNWFDFY